MLISLSEVSFNEKHKDILQKKPLQIEAAHSK